MQQPIDHLNPGLPAGLRRVTMPLVDASDQSLARYAAIETAPER